MVTQTIAVKVVCLCWIVWESIVLIDDTVVVRVIKVGVGIVAVRVIAQPVVVVVHPLGAVVRERHRRVVDAVAVGIERTTGVSGPQIGLVRDAVAVGIQTSLAVVAAVAGHGRAVVLLVGVSVVIAVVRIGVGVGAVGVVAQSVVFVLPLRGVLWEEVSVGTAWVVTVPVAVGVRPLGRVVEGIVAFGRSVIAVAITVSVAALRGVAWESVREGALLIVAVAVAVSVRPLRRVKRESIVLVGHVVAVAVRATGSSGGGVAKDKRAGIEDQASTVVAGVLAAPIVGEPVEVAVFMGSGDGREVIDKRSVLDEAAGP